MTLLVPIVAYSRLEDGSHRFESRDGRAIELYRKRDRELTLEEHRQAAACLAWAASGLQYKADRPHS